MLASLSVDMPTAEIEDSEGAVNGADHEIVRS
jgi:hypothetical protein